MVSVVVISPDDSEGVVLAKMMELAKEIRSGDKKRGAAPAVGRAALWSAGGWPWRCCWRLADDCLSGEPERQGGRARRRGWWCCRWRPGLRGDGLPGVDGAGNNPAAILLYLISN